MHAGRQEHAVSGTFRAKLDASARANDSWLCVGLDPDPALAPPGLPMAAADEWIVELNRAVIQATHDLVCCYKPNLAFYEALGEPGLRALRETLRLVPAHVPVIGDAKRADITHTSRAYAEALFGDLGFDAVTVPPYLGRDSLAPFFEDPGRGVLVLCKTSNPGSGDLQDILVRGPDGRDEPLYLRVARLVQEWDRHGTAGLVVGATYPRELAAVRAVAPDLPILVPGVGAQAGDLEAAVRAGVDARGGRVVVNASRGVMYAGAAEGRWPGAVREAALSLRERINQARSAPLAAASVGAAANVGAAGGARAAAGG